MHDTCASRSRFFFWKRYGLLVSESDMHDDTNCTQAELLVNHPNAQFSAASYADACAKPDHFYHFFYLSKPNRITFSTKF